MSQALGNEVDRAMVSQATRDMAGGRYKAPDLAAEITATQEDLSAKLARKRQVEGRLCELNARFIGGSPRLPTADYRAICLEQESLKKELGGLTADVANLQIKVGKLKDRETKERKARDPQKDHVEPMSPILREILGELQAIRRFLEAKVPPTL